MATEYESVDIWVGTFPSQESLDEYLEETYSEEPEGDDNPISKFAEDQGESFYDHDFMESSFQEGTSSCQALILPHSYSNSYLASALEAWQEAGLENANTAILVWGDQIEAPCSVSNADYKLIYLGRFDCDPS